jgi:prepilin-type N-terminal cleavage/methylation domain-containing protein
MKSERKKFSRSGYTLVEILLVLGMIAILAGISMPIYQTFQVKNYLNLGVSNTVQALRRAQLLSQAIEGDANWGVKIESGRIVLFKGVNFSSREEVFDEVSELPESVVPSLDTEFVFQKLSGEPQATGTLVLTANNGESRTLTVNSKGIIEY